MARRRVQLQRGWVPAGLPAAPLSSLPPPVLHSPRISPSPCCLLSSHLAPVPAALSVRDRGRTTGWRSAMGPVPDPIPSPPSRLAGCRPAGQLLPVPRSVWEKSFGGENGRGGQRHHWARSACKASIREAIGGHWTPLANTQFQSIIGLVLFGG
ncbi:unnamed protein product [Alopecurus aequalis]